MTSLKSDELLVIGAGLGRTGTASLKDALEIVLPGKCYHMKDIIFGGGRDINTWIKAFENGGLSREEWKSLFQGYTAITDYPGAPLFEHLMSVYPNAKIILSVREPHSWVKSVRNTLVHVQETTSSFPTNLFIRLVIGRFHTLMKHMLKEFSIDDIKNNEQKAVDDFNKWTEHVKSRVPPQKLLVFEASMGWKPLCEFLNVPIPPGSYPRTNDTDEFVRRIKILKIVSNSIFYGIPLALAAGGYFLFRYSVIQF